MNSELEAIMKRRRRRADGGHSPGRNKSGDEGDSKPAARKPKGSRRKNNLDKIKTMSKENVLEEDTGTIASSVFSNDREDSKPAGNLKYRKTGFTDDEYSSSEDECSFDINFTSNLLDGTLPSSLATMTNLGR